MTKGAPGGKTSLLAAVARACGTCCGSRHLHALAHLLWQGIKVILAIVFLLWTIGIPGLLLSKHLQPQVDPFHVEVARITWSPPRGLVVHDAELFDTRLSTGAIARVGRCVIRPSYRRLLQGVVDIRSVRWENGAVVLPQHDDTNDTIRLAPPMLKEVQGEVLPRDGRATLAIRAVSDLGTRYRIQGVIERADGEGVSGHEKTRWPVYLDRFLQSSRRTPEWVTFVRNRAHQMTFADPPALDVTFTYDAGESNQPSGTVTYTAPAFLYLGQPFDGITTVLTRSNGVVRIEEASTRQGTNRLSATGAYDHRSGMFEAHVYSALPTTAAMPFLPDAWREKAGTWGLSVAGAMQAEAWIGPCPVDEAPRNWGGWAMVTGARLNDFPIDRAFASFKRTGTCFRIEDGRIAGGTGIGRGDLLFSMTTDYAGRTSQGACAMTLEMRQLTNTLPRGLRMVANFFGITNRPVSFHGRYATPLDDLDQLVVTGDIQGTNGTFRGVTVTGFNTTLVYSNNHVILDPFLVTCPTGAVTGALRLDLRQQHYDVDLEITSNPRVVAPMGGTNLARYFRYYHFTDDVLVRVKGMIDAKNDQRTDLAVTMGGRGMGYGPFTFDRLSAEARALPGRVLISNLTGIIYGGSVTGRIDLALEQGSNRFHAALAATNVSLDKMIAGVTGQPTNQYEGALACEVDIAGNLPEPKGWPGVTGTGSVVIKDGRLLRIPVFGGLSRLLEKIYPGLGFSEQNLLEATLTMGDGAVRTDDLRLSGSVVSLSAKGSYKWTDELDFNVKVHPFRDGSIATVLRIVTMPISFILELEMTGPWKNPSWKPANFSL